MTVDCLIEAEDLVATVSGELKLKDFDDRLIEQGLISALSAPAGYSITELLEQGWLHDSRQVLGLALKHIDGSRTKTGGKVIKNVAGYDLSKIYLGSHGQFAQIERASLRLQKLPTKTCVFTVELKELDFELISFVHQITTMDFDDSCDALINQDQCWISFSANGDELLELKQRRMQTRLEAFGLKFEIEIKSYTKEYPSADLRIEAHTMLSNLLPLAQSLDSYSIFPKRGYVLGDHIKSFKDTYYYIYPYDKELDLKLNTANNDEQKLLKELEQEFC